MRKHRRNPADEQYEILGSDTLKGIVLFGGVLIAAAVAYRVYRSAKSRDVVSGPGIIKIPIQIPNVAKQKTA